MPQVELKGTWVRSRTTSGDLWFMRRRLVDIGPDRGVRGTLVAKRQDAEDREREERHGTFRVNVELAEDYRSYKTKASQARARAKAILEWFLQDHTCRPPKIKVTSSRIL